MIKVGIIGCGNISAIYLQNAAIFAPFEIIACADVDPALASRTAEANAITALNAGQLLASPEIDVVLNLTPPAVHHQISVAAIDQGKHVYSEKPLGQTVAEGHDIVARAAAAGVYLGCAPDTVLGANIQRAAALIDAGQIGAPLFAEAVLLSHGMERWHPNPASFYSERAGPVMDIGPYYIAALITLLGPVASVTALGCRGYDERTVQAPTARLRGERFPVEVLTTVQALLRFVSGAQASVTLSWDVAAPPVRRFTVHGRSSLELADPNWFGGALGLFGQGAPPQPIQTEDMCFGVANYEMHLGKVANYRGLGLATMAAAIVAGTACPLGGAFALHTLAVLRSICDATVSSREVVLPTIAFDPPRLSEAAARALLRSHARSSTTE